MGRLTQLTVIDWNLNGMRPLRDQHRLLHALDWDVLALQEVTGEAFEQLVGEFPDAVGHHAAHYTTGVSKRSGKDVPFYAAVFVREPLVTAESWSLLELPSPERSMIVSVEVDDTRFLVASLAIPPGVSWKEMKVEQVLGIASWLAERRQPVVFGMDRNAPKWDAFDHADCVWWWDEERRLFGEDAAHDARDVFRAHLEANPDQVDRVRQLRPRGPLALTYMRGHKANFAIPCRYDVIYASPEFGVIDVEHVYDDAIAAGSDHGLVQAVLRLQS